MIIVLGAVLLIVLLALAAGTFDDDDTPDREIGLKRLTAQDYAFIAAPTFLGILGGGALGVGIALLMGLGSDWLCSVITPGQCRPFTQEMRYVCVALWAAVSALTAAFLKRRRTLAGRVLAVLAGGFLGGFATLCILSGYVAIVGLGCLLLVGALLGGVHGARWAVRRCDG